MARDPVREVGRGRDDQPWATGPPCQDAARTIDAVKTSAFHPWAGPRNRAQNDRGLGSGRGQAWVMRPGFWPSVAAAPGFGVALGLGEGAWAVPETVAVGRAAGVQVAVSVAVVLAGAGLGEGVGVAEKVGGREGLRVAVADAWEVAVRVEEAPALGASDAGGLGEAEGLAVEAGVGDGVEVAAGVREAVREGVADRLGLGLAVTLAWVPVGLGLGRRVGIGVALGVRV